MEVLLDGQLGHHLLELVGPALELEFGRRLAAAAAHGLGDAAERVLAPGLDHRGVHRKAAGHLVHGRLGARTPRACPSRMTTS